MGNLRCKWVHDNLPLLAGGELVGLVFGAGAAADPADLRIVLILAVAAICVQQLDAIFAATLRGLEKFGHQALMEIAARIGSRTSPACDVYTTSGSITSSSSRSGSSTS